MKQEKRQCLQRVDVLAGLVDDTEPVCIAVRRKTDVTSRFADCLAERFQLRHHWLRIDPAKQRVRIAANRLNCAGRAAQKIFENVSAAAVHGIDHDLQVRFRNPVPINQ